ncbi:MAG: hypothetical protein HY863_07235 [Chloroflexi bacterium]|nr:hypothetical protein [Chloroflexota bacterium]
MNRFLRKEFEYILFPALFGFVLCGSIRGFYNIVSGTGTWLGEFSLKWGAAFLIYIAVCVCAFIIVIFSLRKREKLRFLIEKAVSFRERLGNARWLSAILVFISPVWLFQYTAWGLVFSDVYIRILIWSLVVLLFAFFIKKGDTLFGWTEFLAALLLTSSEFVIAVPFMNVTDHPFSLGWSEGNRMWDYSIMFGRQLYDYPADKNIYVLLDIGRQFVGGLPFIIPGLSIETERFWIALTVIIPYFLLGLAIFRFARTDRKVWLLASLWVLIFLKQGPIHPPLVLCAVIVALLWRSPLWLALPLIALTGYAAEESRYTWLFAPGMWIGMLELAGAALRNKKLNLHSWIRAVLLGLAGIAGGYLGPKIAGLLAGNSAAQAAISTSGIVEHISNQPLLWYRLLPNATYGIGILAGLLIAVLPLIIVLSYLAASKKWVLNVWQGLAVTVPLLAFLVVGLIVSTKIGGGGDLHNMDMFLIGLMFAGVLAWQNGGKVWLEKIDLAPIWVKLVIVLLLGVPGLQSLTVMRSYNFEKDASWLATLTDAENARELDMLPSQETTDHALNIIREEVAMAQSNGGEVLFLDQRQLLTFGYIRDVPLVPEYEKKLLMNEALSSNAAYFENFFADISAHRFALIVSEPLLDSVKDSSFQFGEENNAWIKWVSNPLLCYYESKTTLKDVGVQLLIPKTSPTDCSTQLPQENQ